MSMSNDRHELERRLRVAGQAPAPEPRAAFADTLEQRLRTRVRASAPPVRRAARRAVPWSLGVVAAAASLAGALGIVALVDGDERSVRVATATDAFVVLPDGTVDGVEAGLVVPEGALLKTGDEGRVVAGEVELGPNREAVVSDGTLRPAPPAEAPPPAPPAEPPPPPPPAEPPAAVPPPEPVTPPTTAWPVRPEPTTTTTAPTPPPTRPQEPVMALRLEARYRDTAVRLTWSPYTGRRFGAYVVLRSRAPAEPRYPADENTTVVARIPDPAATRYFDSVRDPAGHLYRVVAVDPDGRPLAKSPAVQPEPAVTTDPWKPGSTTGTADSAQPGVSS